MDPRGIEPRISRVLIDEDTSPAPKNPSVTRGE